MISSKLARPTNRPPRIMSPNSGKALDRAVDSACLVVIFSSLALALATTMLLPKTRGINTMYQTIVNNMETHLYT